jgi:hypothetical protein
MDEAIEYVTQRLPAGKTWKNPRQNLTQHVNRGNLTAAEPRRRGRQMRFTMSELARFLAWLEANPSGNRVDLGAVEGRLGQASDQVLADEAGVSWRTVHRRRKKRAVPASTPVDLSPIRDRLGKEPDGKLAGEMGVHRLTVRKYRGGLEITAYKRGKG